MIFLSFFIGNHDSSVAAFVNGEVKYAKSERITSIKHHRADLDFIKKICEDWGIEKPTSVAYSGLQRESFLRPEIGELAVKASPFSELWGDVPTYYVDHHYAHVLSAWAVVPMDEVDIGFAIDGRGDNELRISIIQHPGSLNSKLVASTQHYSFGSTLRRIGNLMGLEGHRVDMAGKVMGAEAYGSIDWDHFDLLDKHSLDSQAIDNKLHDLIFQSPWRGEVPIHKSNFFNFGSSSFRDWLATTHKLIESHTLRLFEEYANPNQIIVYSGGCAQNVICNERLYKRFPKLFIPPHCYDGGISLGCLEFLRLQYQHPSFSSKGFPYWQNDYVFETPTSDTLERVVDLLEQGKIVGWFQGRGEIGPRALGNRSILMDARRGEAKAKINEEIKHREHWRPYAPSVLLSKAHEWFDLAQPSPYMLRAVSANPEKINQIPGVVHCDGTSRVQTVSDSQVSEPLVFTLLLTKFYERTNVPVLLNTSLNRGGLPILSSVEQSLDFYKNSSLDAICIGSDLHQK